MELYLDKLKSVITLTCSVLAIGAHPDDIELGCLGTLLRHKLEGSKINLLVLSNGEASGDPKQREDESDLASKLLGANQVVYAGLPDTKIEHNFETINVIENIIKQVEPKIIYTHSFRDTHQDHKNASLATLSAGRRTKKILLYESPTTFASFVPNFYVNLTEKLFFEKKQILEVFTSQNNKDWWKMGQRAASAIEGLAMYRGYQSGVLFAEAFEVSRFVIDQNETLFPNHNNIL